MLCDVAETNPIDRPPEAAVQPLAPGAAQPFPAGLVLTPLARNPIRLETDTSDLVLNRPVPEFIVQQDPIVYPGQHCGGDAQ